MNTPLFQHRHYVKMAAIIAQLPEAMRFDVANHFAMSLNDTNANFDLHRFKMAAVGTPANGRDKP